MNHIHPKAVSLGETNQFTPCMFRDLCCASGECYSCANRGSDGYCYKHGQYTDADDTCPYYA